MAILLAGDEREHHLLGDYSALLEEFEMKEIPRFIEVKTAFGETKLLSTAHISEVDKSSNETANIVMTNGNSYLTTTNYAEIAEVLFYEN